MEIVNKIKHHFFTREFFLFLVIGAFNTVNNSIIAKLIIFLGVNENIAFNIGYMLANISAYILNSYFIFHVPLKLKTYIKFFVSYIPNYIIQNIIVYIAFNILGLMDIVSFLIAAILGVPITFLFVKIFTFGRH